MEADDLIGAGRLVDAADRLREVVRARPLDASARVALLTLLGLSGDWDRVGRQIDAMGAQGHPATPGIDFDRFRSLVVAERARAAILGGDGTPRTFGDPDRAETVALDAWRLVAKGEAEAARTLLDGLEEGRPARSGRLGDEPFDDFRDADDLLAPVLEVFTPEGYFWVGWGRVRFLDVAPPRSLLDLLWAPARLSLDDGLIGRVALPGLYPGSSAYPDEAVRLGRENAWIEVGSGLVRGAGPKVFDVGGRPRALVELHGVAFDQPGDADPAEDRPVVSA